MLAADTGSPGVAVPLGAAIWPAWDASTTPGYIFYSSDGKYHPGNYVRMPTQPGASADGMRAAARIGAIEVLAAQCTCDVVATTSASALKQVPDSCPAYDGRLALGSGGKQMLRNCQTISPGVGVLGVGDDRGVAAARNPFLNLAQMRAGRMSAGYIVTASGIALGVSAQALNGFSLIPLQRTAASARVDGDWQAPNARAGFSDSGSDYQACGKLLPATGIGYSC